MDIDVGDICHEENFLSFQTVTGAQTLLRNSSEAGGLTALCLNIRSIRKNWEVFLGTIHPIIDYLKIIILNEINITEEEGKLYGIPGFSSELKCRPTGLGGGILILYRDDIGVERLESHFLSAELLSLKISLNNVTYMMGAFYRPPSFNVNDFNHELETWITSNTIGREKNFIMIGDINICYLNKMYGWENYLNTLSANGIFNTIRTFTREELLNNNIVSSCLDHVNLRFSDASYKSFTINNKVADHLMIGFEVTPNKKQINFKSRIPIYRDVISTKKVNEAIQKENWWPILDMEDPETIYRSLCQKFNKIYRDSKIKVKNMVENKFNPWFNPEIEALIRKKERLWTLTKGNRNDHNLRNLFKQARNTLTNKIRQAKRNYYFKLFSDSIKDVKKTWSLVNEIINKKARPSLVDTLKQNFKIDNDPDLHNLTETFQVSFMSTIDTIKGQLQGIHFDLTDQFMPGNYNIGESLSFNLPKLNDDSLYSIFNKLNSGSSAGPDGIRPKDVKNNYTFLKMPLMHLINRIILTGFIPKDLKITYLRPIYKNGHKNDPNNYRPIGSISVFSKILEHHVCTHLMCHVSRFKVIHEAQYGFMPSRSTIDLLEVLTTDINKGLNECKFIVGAALDLSRAFDMVDYGLMVNKLKKIGVGGRLLRLFEDYFSDRTIKVSIGPHVSSPSPQTCGLIQGSIISPILFNIYVNDLAHLKLHSKILQYADDTILYFTHVKLDMAISCMQSDLNLLVKYFFNNSIKLNTNKTKVIIFKNPKKRIGVVSPLKCHDHACFRPPQECQCQDLIFYNSIKHLGIHLDADMKYNTHVSHLRNILCVTMFKLYRMNESLPIHTKRLVYFALVQSVVHYGITLYYTGPNHIVNQIKSVLVRLVKMFFNNIPIGMLGIMSFETLAKYTDLRRNYFQENFRNIQQVDYSLRNQRYTVARFFNSYGKALPEYRIPLLLNDLPENLRSIESIGQVRRDLRNYFLRLQ